MGGSAVVEPLAVVMADERSPIAGARPIVAGLRRLGAVGQRSGENVVAVRRVAAAVDDIALFVERGVLGDAVLVAVEGGDVVGDLLALGIVPRTAADAVLGVD